MKIDGIIKSYNDKECLYKDGLSNHLNMGLYAMYRMGASEERLHEYAKGYIEYNELKPLSPVKYRITRKNYGDYLGVADSYSSYVLFFYQLVNGYGADDVMAEFVDGLLAGSSGDAFHGLIRLGYAYELGDRDEVAKALAYMASCYKVFEPKLDVKMTDNPYRAVELLAKESELNSLKFRRPLIAGRMMDVYDTKVFHEKVTSLGPEYGNFLSLFLTAVNLYKMTDDFTMLHGVTSTYALYRLQEFLGDWDMAINRHWYLLQLAYCSTGCVAIDKKVEDSELSWDEIELETVRKKDVHTIKLIYVLKRLSDIIGEDDLLRALAVRKLRDSY